MYVLGDTIPHITEFHSLPSIHLAGLWSVLSEMVYI